MEIILMCDNKTVIFILHYIKLHYITLYIGQCTTATYDYLYKKTKKINIFVYQISNIH